MPTKYRERLRESCSGQLVITIDQDHCLLLYPLPTWENVEQQLIRLSSTNKRARNLKRLLLGHAEECPIDSHGRILLPQPLREFAHLDKRVVLVGQGNKFELWDELSWNQFRQEWLEGKDQDGNSLSAELELLAF
jgi:MraZ protein